MCDVSWFVQCLSGVDELLELAEAVWVEMREKKIFFTETHTVYLLLPPGTDTHSF